MPYILTASGRHFELPVPDLDAIEISDIALALSRECRFSGHTLEFYSVAQHSVMVSENVPDDLALEGLLHDAHEAYCRDLASPLRSLLPDFNALVQRLDRAIRLKFGLPGCMSPQVHQADMLLLATERRDLMPADPAPWPCLDGFPALPGTIHPLGSEAARRRFLIRFLELTNRKEL